jgi:hypothetical protein
MQVLIFLGKGDIAELSFIKVFIKNVKKGGGCVGDG